MTKPMPSSARSSDFQADILARVRNIIMAADPEITEEAKWKKSSNGMRGVPVWERDGIICTGETYKDKVKLTFARGAAVDDPAGLFNASLDGNVRRAIDIFAGDSIDEKALTALVRAAIALNIAARTAKTGAAKKKAAKKTAKQ